MKFAGEVGFWLENAETEPGIYGEKFVERRYTGDISRAYHKWGEQTDTDSTLRTLRLNNQVSIVADLFAQENYASIKYIVWKGVPWEVNAVGFVFPRLTLEIGGVWHGPRAAST